MIELLHWDQELFHLINVSGQNMVFDWVMPMLRDKYFWIPLYLFIASFLWINFGRKGLYVILIVIICTGLTDSISSHLIKKTVQRERPCKVYQHPADIHILVNCGSGYSFPSSHAANHFSLSVYLILVLGSIFRWIKIPLLLWAVTVAFAQVYVGVHYPVDVLAGAILGSLMATGTWRISRLWFGKLSTQD